MMRTVTLALAASAVCLRVSAQVQTFEDGYWPAIRLAAQEPDGPVHAAGSGEAWGQWNLNENWQPGGNSPWNPWGSSDTATGIPQSMETAADGSAISIWTRKGDGTIFVCSQHGNIGVTAWLSGLNGPAALARALVDSHSNLWVTEAALNIRKAPPRQNQSLVHTIIPDELWPSGNATNRLPVPMAEDARGRIWFWSDCRLGDDARGAIHGVLIHENGAITNRPVLQGVPDGRISVIAPLDGNTLWLAVRYQGIFSVNPDTLAGAQVAEPETNAFRFVQNIFSVGRDRFVISGSQADFNHDGLVSVLWRWRDGRWTKVVDGLDTDASPEQLAGRHWTVTKDGLWLGSFGMGGWFVPLDDRPTQAINWQKNSPFDTINRWFHLKGGQMMGLQFGRGAIVADPALLMEPPVRPASAAVIHTARPLVQTENGSVFGFLRGRQGMLCEWYGRSWHEHPLPDDFQPDGGYETILDSLNRIWWVHLPYSTPDSTPTCIFDRARAQFEKFSSYPSALQAQLSHLPGLRLGANEYFAPKFSTNGQICFEDSFWKLYYFNGHVWHEWEKSKISNPQPWYQARVNPFFATDGSLAVTLNNVTWSFSELEGWRTNTVARPAEDGKIVPGENPFPPAPPPGSSIESTATDRLGVCWLTSGGKLFRSAFGLTRECFPANEPEPFADGRKLTEVLTDNLGNAFLRTSVQGRDEYVLLPAREPLPRAKAELVENDDDGVVLKLAADIPSPLFIWRLDDAPWSRASTNQTLRLDDLPAGRHRVRVIALDQQLQVSPDAAAVFIEPLLAPAERIQEWMKELGDKDYTRREAAVRGLSRNARSALPALREARQSETDPDRRWWLDAAIQQCEH
jgi:hypothetical protein